MSCVSGRVGRIVYESRERDNKTREMCVQRRGECVFIFSRIRKGESRGMERCVYGDVTEIDFIRERIKKDRAGKKN